MPFAADNHRLEEIKWPNQSMKPAPRLQEIFNLFATTPALAYLCLVRPMKSKCIADGFSEGVRCADYLRGMVTVQQFSL